ncbi:MAG: hypothetical protein V3W18_07680 [candidate division Zixibacteria bacterium]
MFDNDLKLKNANKANDIIAVNDTSNNALAQAKEHFSDNDFQKTIDVCEKITSMETSSDSNSIILEAFYLWCLACLKLNRLDEVLDVCSKSRARFDSYIDLAYFELIAVCARGAIPDIPGFAQQYMNLWSKVEKGADPHKNRTFGLAGQVLLMWGQALEQLRSPDEALDIYKKYMLIHPEDTDIADRIASMETPENLKSSETG